MLVDEDITSEYWVSNEREEEIPNIKERNFNNRPTYDISHHFIPPS